MERLELLRMLRMSHDEIVTLRRTNAELAPRAHAYDTIAQLSRLTENNEPRGMQEDVAWLLKQAVEKIEAERLAEAE
jgi:hypothetical protein